MLIATEAKSSDINGTSLQGYIEITLAELIEALGQPTSVNLDKVTAQWAFKTREGVVFTIYDYKEDEIPTGKYDWHIGGHDRKAVSVLSQAFPKHHVASLR